MDDLRAWSIDTNGDNKCKTYGKIITEGQNNWDRQYDPTPAGSLSIYILSIEMHVNARPQAIHHLLERYRQYPWSFLSFILYRLMAQNTLKCETRNIENKNLRTYYQL